MAKKKSLFDDRPVEISELTYIIKHDLAAINRQLSDLQAQSKSTAAKSNTKDKTSEHRGNVVTLLQTNLASTTTAFQDVLEVRTQNIKASRDRSEHFAYGGGGANGPEMNSGECKGLGAHCYAALALNSDNQFYAPVHNRHPHNVQILHCIIPTETSHRKTITIQRQRQVAPRVDSEQELEDTHLYRRKSKTVLLLPGATTSWHSTWVEPMGTAQGKTNSCRCN